MTTKKFQLIIWVVTLIIVVGSCIIRFAPFSSGRSEESEYDFSKYSVATVKVDADAADLYIEYGDEFKVNTNYQKNVEPKVTLEDECLTIEQKYTVNVRNLKDCYIKITLPKGTVIDTANISASAGDIDIDGVNFDTLKIDADAGDIDINEVNANDFVIEADAGDIDVSKSVFETVKVTTDAGAVKMEDVSATSGTFDADMGSIDINGDFEKITASCEMGDIDITVPDANKVDFDLDCELGSIKVNGSRWKN